MASSQPTSSSSPHDHNHDHDEPPPPSSPVPPPVPVETHPNRAGGLKTTFAAQQQHHHHQQQHQQQGPPSDPSRLAPEDAYYAQPSPPRLRSINAPPGHPQQQQHQQQHAGNAGAGHNHAASLRVPSSAAAAVAALRPPPAVPGSESKGHWRDGSGGTSGRRRQRRKRQWKKLLWVKQSYPDNYTDTETFLDHLQRNPRLRPYDFWPLVADFTVIVQHVCSVAIFLCCFTVIFQERVSPVTVVSWGSMCTILGWVMWDFWVSQEHLEAARLAASSSAEATGWTGGTTTAAASTVDDSASATSASSGWFTQGLGLALSDLGSKTPSRESTGLSSTHSCSAPAMTPSTDNNPSSTSMVSFSEAYQTPYGTGGGGSNTPSTAASSSSSGNSSSSSSILSPRNRQRVATAKSAVLIFCALQGFSPILKSLTKSTTSDSIWAMSCWLMVINIFFFDYGTGGGGGSSSISSDESVGTTAVASPSPAGSGNAAKFPASLSTNAALMASTVLASRLKSTTHVFSLTLFSIEVFGLFPVFRRQLRAISWRGHVFLTLALVVAASGAVGITLRGGLAGAILGILIGCPATSLAMGGCSWWLIGLQRYKNVVTGPWDTAKPILRRRWD